MAEYDVTCPGCGCTIHADTEIERTEKIQQHAKEQHNIDLIEKLRQYDKEQHDLDRTPHL